MANSTPRLLTDATRALAVALSARLNAKARHGPQAPTGVLARGLVYRSTADIGLPLAKAPEFGNKGAADP